MRAQRQLVQYLIDRGLKPSALRIDNECHKALHDFFRAKNVNFQLCLSNDHCTNQSEKEIDTWKFQFLAGISGVDPNFSIHLWCRLLLHATQTLNLLRRSRIKPRLSAEAQLNGVFECNQTPMAPPGTKVLIHDILQHRRTW